MLNVSFSARFNNSDKGAVTHSIVHRALWEYLCAINGVSDESEQERLRREVFESCQEVIAEMVHTKDGSRVVREFLAQGTAKVQSDFSCACLMVIQFQRIGNTF